MGCPTPKILLRQPGASLLRVICSVLLLHPSRKLLPPGRVPWYPRKLPPAVRMSGFRGNGLCLLCLFVICGDVASLSSISCISCSTAAFIAVTNSRSSYFAGCPWGCFCGLLRSFPCHPGGQFLILYLRLCPRHQACGFFRLLPASGRPAGIHHIYPLRVRLGQPQILLQRPDQHARHQDTGNPGKCPSNAHQKQIWPAAAGTPPYK